MGKERMMGSLQELTIEDRTVASLRLDWPLPGTSSLQAQTRSTSSLQLSDTLLVGNVVLDV